MRNTRVTVMERVDRSDDCWRWLGSHTTGGRPQVNFDGRHWYVYRLLYTWLVGPIPEGMTLDHIGCDNGRCCNPFHCVPATNRENVRRALDVRYADREACPSGHPKSEHQRRRSSGAVWCAECNRIKCRERGARRRSAA